MKYNYQLILAASLMSVSAMAQGNGAGNGGRVWVCYHPENPITHERSIKSVELLDYKEQKTTGIGMIDLGVDHPGIDDTESMIEVALKRLERVDQFRAKKIREKVAEVKTRSKTISMNDDQTDLKKILDANVLIKPTANCEERQAAFNISNPDPLDARYVFIAEYTGNKMSDTDRAGLILHEAIYNYEAEKGAKNSDGTRKMVRAISSPALDQFTPKGWYDFSFRYSVFPSVTALNGTYEGIMFFDDNTTLMDQLTWLDEYNVQHGHLLGILKFDQVCIKDTGYLIKSLELLSEAHYYVVFDKVKANGKVCLASGGTVTMPKYSFKTENISADNIEATKFRLKNIELSTLIGGTGETTVDSSFELKNPIQVSMANYASFLHSSGKSIEIKLESNDHFGLIGTIKLNSEGDLQDLSFTVARDFDKAIAKLTDTKGRTISSHIGYPNIDLLANIKHLHVAFNPNGEITEWNTFRK